MSKRYFQADSGKWYDGYHQGTFTDDGKDDANRIALVAGEPVTPITVDDTTPDPRDGNRFSDPVVMLPPKEKTPDEILSEELEVATTLTALKTALIKRFGG